MIIQTSGTELDGNGEVPDGSVPEPLIPTQRASTPAGSDFFRTLDGTQPCVQHPEAFFPAAHDNANAQKRVCRGCAFLQPCGEYAVAHPAEEGVWGGLTQNDRDDIRKRLRRAS